MNMYEYEIVCEIILNILRVSLMKRTMELFLVMKESDKKKLNIGYGIYYILTTVLYCCFQISVIYEMCNFLGVIGIAFLYQDTWRKRLWTSLTLFSMDMACSFTMLFAVGRDYNYYLERTSGILLFLLCNIAISHISYPSERKEISFDVKQTLFLVFIPAISILVLVILFYGKIKGSFGAAVCLCMLGINLSVFYLYYIIMENYIHLWESDLYKQQTYAYQNQLEVIMESQNKIRSLRHDMKNHILALQVLLQKNDIKEMKKYIDSMSNFMANPKEYVQTGNKTIDSLLNYKLQQAEKVLDKIETKIHIPEKIQLHSFDLNIVLGNLLDNAIEAAVKTEEKKLKLVLCLDRGILFLNIYNSCISMKEGKWDGLETTKEDTKHHGIGLKNVKNIVEKYHGDMEILCENNTLEIDIIMYINEM